MICLWIQQLVIYTICDLEVLLIRPQVVHYYFIKTNWWYLRFYHLICKQRTYLFCVFHDPLRFSVWLRGPPRSFSGYLSGYVIHFFLTVYTSSVFLPERKTLKEERFHRKGKSQRFTLLRTFRE